MAKKTKTNTKVVALFGLVLMIFIGIGVVMLVPEANPFEPQMGQIPTNSPVACTLEFAPVCGEDGFTYSNTCHAEASGTTVRHEGECEPQSLFDQLYG